MVFIEKNCGMECYIFSGSISLMVMGRFMIFIDEEDFDFVFSMEEEDELMNGCICKRVFVGFSMGIWGSYVGVVFGKFISGGSKDGVVVYS